MMIALHKQARTTPAVRAEMAASPEPVAALARRYGISEATVRFLSLNLGEKELPIPNFLSLIK